MLTEKRKIIVIALGQLEGWGIGMDHVGRLVVLSKPSSIEIKPGIRLQVECLRGSFSQMRVRFGDIVLAGLGRVLARG